MWVECHFNVMGGTMTSLCNSLFAKLTVSRDMNGNSHLLLHDGRGFVLKHDLKFLTQRDDSYSILLLEDSRHNQIK